MFKKVLYITPVLLLFLFSLFRGIDRFIYRKQLHFSPTRITAHHEPVAEWEIPALAQEEKNAVNKILNQEFTYFGKSAHAYLFLSSDRKYILKFLKQSFPKSVLSHFPISFNPYYKEYHQKLEQQRNVFTACNTAFMHLKEETGLIYVHINPTQTLNKKISVYDRNGKHFNIKIDKTSFYIQKRAQMIYPRISELMRSNDVENAKKIITSVYSLIDCLGRKGVCDTDLAVYKNFGIIDDKAVQLMISKVCIHPSVATNKCYKQKIPAIVEPLGRWILKNYPELFPHFESELQEGMKFCNSLSSQCDSDK